MGNIVDSDTTAVSAVVSTTAGAGGLVVGVGDEDAADAGAIGGVTDCGMEQGK